MITKTTLDKLTCPFCNKKTKNKKALTIHIKRMSLPEKINYWISQPDKFLEGIPSDILFIYYNKMIESNILLRSTNKTKFKNFYKNITSVRPFNINIDFITYFDKLIPWQKEHPKASSGKALASIIFDSKEESNKLYEIMKSKNPFTGHDCTLSPFSKNFIGYKHLNEEEKKKAQLAASKLDQEGRSAVQTAYWTKKGFTLEEAVKKVTERQTTFSLDICIKKHGKERGTEIWSERQKKWLSNYKKSNFSKVSQDLFWQIYDIVKNEFKEIYFATLNASTKLKDLSGKNHEFMFKLKRSYAKLDFYAKDDKKVIEFDGDYWHSLEGREEREKDRDLSIINAGIDILHVKEGDYYNSPSDIINKCIKFLKIK